MRMNKRRWIAVSAAVMILSVGVLTAGVIAAQTADDDSTVGEFSTRVAEILGLDAQTVDDAMRQAREGLHTEKIQSRLDEMVQSGNITQEQADEYVAWIESAPDGVYDARMRGRGFGRGHHHVRGRHGRGFFN